VPRQSRKKPVLNVPVMNLLHGRYLLRIRNLSHVRHLRWLQCHLPEVEAETVQVQGEPWYLM
jgi:hypothetical protein